MPSKTKKPKPKTPADPYLAVFPSSQRIVNRKSTIPMTSLLILTVGTGTAGTPGPDCHQIAIMVNCHHD